MKNSSQVRNFAVAGHSGAGKTSLCDSILFKSGAVDRCGSVEQKTSISDYTADEHDRLSSIYATPLYCEYNDTDFFFIDSPGYGEYIGETVSAICASDNALLVVDGVSGIEVGTSIAWQLAKKNELPRFIFINRLDKELADFDKVLNQLQDVYGKTVCIPMTMPVGKESGLQKVIQVMKDTDVPDELSETVAKYKEYLMDTIAESDEELMLRYLDGEQLSEEEIATGLHKAILSGSLVPVFAGSVTMDIGVQELMDGITSLAASPLAVKKVLNVDDEEIEVSESGTGLALVFKSIVDPFIGQLTFFRVRSGVFKSDGDVYNVSTRVKERFGTLFFMNGKNQEQVNAAGPGCIVGVAKLKDTHINDTLSTVQKEKELKKIVFPNTVMSYAVTAAKSGEEEKISEGLNKLSESDPTVKIERNVETRELILSGMGALHLSNIVTKLKENSKVDVVLNSPKIPYRETVTAMGEGHYRHKKQSGGHGQFGEVFLKIAPKEDGYEFLNEVVGGNIPKNFIPAVEKGVVEAMEQGPLAGCKVQNMAVTVYDGKHHPVDSSEMSFKIAARMAFRDAMSKANPILLEPIMSVKISVPDEYMGDINGDLNHKRGRILGMAMEEGLQVVDAEVPLSEMSRYAAELRSMTQGRGLFEMEFTRYEMVPSNVAMDIIDKHKKQQEEE